MRTNIAVLCALVSACGYAPTNDSPDARLSTSGTPDTQPVENDSWLDAPCETDADCGSDVCSALLRCAPVSTLRTITVTWTANLMPASTTACNHLGISTVMASLFSEESFPDVVSLRNILLECSSGQWILENVPPLVSRIGFTAFGNVVEDVYAWFVIDGTSLSFDMTQLPRQ